MSRTSQAQVEGIVRRFSERLVEIGDPDAGRVKLDGAYGGQRIVVQQGAGPQDGPGWSAISTSRFGDGFRTKSELWQQCWDMLAALEKIPGKVDA